MLRSNYGNRAEMLDQVNIASSGTINQKPGPQSPRNIQLSRQDSPCRRRQERQRSNMSSKGTGVVLLGLALSHGIGRCSSYGAAI